MKSTTKLDVMALSFLALVSLGLLSVAFTLRNESSTMMDATKLLETQAAEIRAKNELITEQAAKISQLKIVLAAYQKVMELYGLTRDPRAGDKLFRVPPVKLIPKGGTI